MAKEAMTEERQSMIALVYMRHIVREKGVPEDLWQNHHSLATAMDIPHEEVVKFIYELQHQ